MQLMLERREKEKLRKLYKSGNGKARQLAQVVLLYTEGWSTSKIASVLKLNPAVIDAYLADANRSFRKPKCKRCVVEPSLDAVSTADLTAYICATPVISVRKIIEYVEQQYGVAWKEPMVHLWLKANKFSYRSKQIVDRIVISKTGVKKAIYRSVAGWHQD